MGRLAIPVTVLAVAIAAGCGGGSAKLTHTQFVSKANAICADYNKRVAALATPNSFDTVVTWSKQLQTIAQDDVGKFKKLNPPDADRSNWQAYGKSGDQVIATAKALEQAAKKQDSAAITKLVSQSRAQSAASKRVATAMGTAECAKT